MNLIRLNKWRLQLMTNGDIHVVGYRNLTRIRSSPLAKVKYRVLVDNDGLHYSLEHEDFGMWKLLIFVRRPRLYKLLQRNDIL